MNWENQWQLNKRASIREAECIGCTKCIQACPVDAILGSAKQMHTVISDECTGCQLCIEPCPVDCIDMLDQHIDVNSEEAKKNQFRARHLMHEKRIQDEKIKNLSLSEKKSYIKAAIFRVREKRKTYSISS
jgi:electron transport complex protein RnfB